MFFTKKWRSILVEWCHSNSIQSISVRECELFENKAIKRKLRPEVAQMVVGSLVATGHGKWEDDAKTRCRIFWKTPKEWAALLYQHARENDMLGTVVTVYELHAGEDDDDQPFAGLDEDTVTAALEVLEAEGKVEIINKGTDSAGVKFFR